MPEAARLAALGDTGRVVGMSFDDGYRDVVENGAEVLAGTARRSRCSSSPAWSTARARFTWYDRQPPVLGLGRDRRARPRLAVPVRGPHGHPPEPAGAAGGRGAGRRSPARGSRSRSGSAARSRRSATRAGLYADRERRLVAEAGFTAAVTCDPGPNGPSTDPLLLRRTAVELRDGLVDFAAKVAGAHDTPLPLRSAYRRLRYGRDAG